MEWTIDAAKKSSVFDSITVSTEDEEIAALAKKFNVDVPFMRPQSLAKDPAGVVDVALHALEELERQGRYYKTLVILLPTCPFRRSADIKDALAIFNKKNAKFLMSVSPFGHTPFAALKINDNGIISPYFPEFIGIKSQEMPAAYRANGAIHILDVAAFKKEKSYYSQPLFSYVMPLEYSIDIDTLHDLQIAEAILGTMKK